TNETDTPFEAVSLSGMFPYLVCSSRASIFACQEVPLTLSSVDLESHWSKDLTHGRPFSALWRHLGVALCVLRYGNLRAALPQLPVTVGLKVRNITSVDM